MMQYIKLSINETNNARGIKSVAIRNEMSHFRKSINNEKIRIMATAPESPRMKSMLTSFNNSQEHENEYTKSYCLQAITV